MLTRRDLLASTAVVAIAPLLPAKADALGGWAEEVIRTEGDWTLIRSGDGVHSIEAWRKNTPYTAFPVVPPITPYFD